MEFLYGTNVTRKIILQEIAKTLLYLRMVHEIEDKEKEKVKACVAQFRRDHEVWSSGDEVEEPDNKRKKGKICMVGSS